MDKISVIVPVYNAQKTLNRCINSLVDQIGGGQIFDYQIVVVNDGSTDDSLKVLFDLAIMYDNIKVLDKVNEGPAAARKYGIENSESDYIAFCDSDDYVEPDWLFTLYTYLRNFDADISMVGAYLNDVNINKKYEKPYSIWEWNQNESILKFIEHIHLNGVLCTNLFKRELFRELDWNLSMKIYEDGFLIWQMLYMIKKIVKVLVPKYHYMFNPNSLTNKNYDQNRYYSYRMLTDRIVSDCSKGNLAIYKNDALKMQYVWTFNNLYAMIASSYYNGKEEKEMRCILRRNFPKCFNSINGLRNKVSALILILSPKLGRTFYKMVKRVN